MPPKLAENNGERGGAPFVQSGNPHFLGHYTEGSQFPRSNTRFPRSNRARVAARLIKQARRRTKKPPWTELPHDLTLNILHRLGAVEILNTAQKVCTTWRSVCKDPAMWRVIDMRSHGELDDMEELIKMCCHAVDRSQGLLVDINLDYFVSDVLFDDITGRFGMLKRLQFVSSYELSDEGLIKGIKRLPKLEELHIIHIYFSEETYEIVGHSCPLLRSFALNISASRSSYCYMDNEDAFAIARSMPKLRHLQLMGNGLTNEGLKAILEGCPHLESFDLRRCFNLKLGEDLEKRLSSQVKCVRYPDESTSDYEFPFEDSDCSDLDISDMGFLFC